MEEKEYIKVFRSGRKEWNKWQERINRKPFEESMEVIYRRHKFTNMDFNNFDFRGYDLRGILFTSSNFHSAKLNSIIGNRKFNLTIIAYVDFSKTNLVMTNFDNCIGIECNFKGSDLSLASFKNAYFSKSNFSDCNLYRTSFERSKLINCNFANSIFDRTNLTDVDLSNSSGSNESIHLNSSTVSINTILFSNNFIDTNFLIKCKAKKQLINLSRKDLNQDIHDIPIEGFL